MSSLGIFALKTKLCGGCACKNDNDEVNVTKAAVVGCRSRNEQGQAEVGLELLVWKKTCNRLLQ